MYLDSISFSAHHVVVIVVLGLVGFVKVTTWRSP
jgi:hypothetical protein